MGLPDDVFVDVAAILLVSALVGALATWLRQPLVVAFVLVGVLVGPSAAGLVNPGQELALLAEIGIAVLLFTVGLKLDLHVVRTLGPVAVVTGVVQMALTAAGGWAIAALFGLGGVESVYVAIGVAFSSTILVVKLLSDQRMIDELHGRIAVGVLIVQDLAVVVVLIAITASGTADGSLPLAFGEVAVKAAVLVAALVLLARWALGPLLNRIARTPDLLVLFAIAWAVALGAAGEELELGTEVGAFLAGVTLAWTPYREALAARLLTVRDFLLLFFFIELGSRIDLGDTAGQLVPGLVLAAFVVVFKPLVVTATLGALRYRSRVGFETGVALAQISEFSLILAALGLSVGHIDDETASLLTLVALLTFGVSTYLILDAEGIYGRLGGRLAVFERDQARDPELESLETPDVVVLGLGRFGRATVEGLRGHGLHVLGVDYDPRALAEAEAGGLQTLYGDLEDPELPRAIPLPHDGWIVSTIRRADANLALIHALEHAGYRGKLAVAAHSGADRRRLADAGADAVLHPYEAAGAEAVTYVTGTSGPLSPSRTPPAGATETSSA